MNEDSIWLSIFEYSKKSGKSISTIRRHIKSGRVISKMEEGKFFIQDQIKNGDEQIYSPEAQIMKLESQINFLKKQLMIAQEEAGELKMLVSLYEKQNQNPSNNSLTSSSNECYQ